jgi:hypothetical protein
MCVNSGSSSVDFWVPNSATVQALGSLAGEMPFGKTLLLPLSKKRKNAHRQCIFPTWLFVLSKWRTERQLYFFARAAQYLYFTKYLSQGDEMGHIEGWKE